MLAGTGSDVGKSVIAAALCRIFRQDGFHPAPFKAQNMALNSYVTPDGLEIGRAQAVQAEAAGIPCHTDMNPILLKPSSELTTQVVLHGKPVGNRHAYEYFRKEGREVLRGEVNAAFDRLNARVPLAELYRYSTTLSSLTSGAATYSMRFSSYEQVPADVQAKLLKEYTDTDDE